MFLARRVVELERLLLPTASVGNEREENFVAEARTDDDDAVECQNSSSSLIATPLYTIGVLHRKKVRSRRTSMRTDAPTPAVISRTPRTPSAQSQRDIEQTIPTTTTKKLHPNMPDILLEFAKDIFILEGPSVCHSLEFHVQHDPSSSNFNREMGASFGHQPSYPRRRPRRSKSRPETLCFL